jgi:hypothetical protein
MLHYNYGLSVVLVFFSALQRLKEDYTKDDSRDEEEIGISEGVSYI